MYSVDAPQVTTFPWPCSFDDIKFEILPFELYYTIPDNGTGNMIVCGKSSVNVL